MLITIKELLRPYLRTILLHTTCWTLFISYEIGTLAYYSGKTEPALNYIIYYVVNISFFYGCIYILNKISGSIVKRLFLGLLYYLLLFACYFILKFASEYFITSSGGGFLKDPASLKRSLVVNTYRGIYFTLLAAFYWLAGHIATYRRKAADAERLKMASLHVKAELEVRLAETRNAYLQQQLSPHSLFNALNFIYSSVYKHSREASRCVLLLSDIMRFSLQETGPDGKIMLTEEILQLRRLEEINRFRYDQQLYFDMIITADFAGLRIIPLILFTLLENVFKHGDLGDKLRPALIFITIDKAGLLRFSSSNAVRQKPVQERNDHTGLKNIRVRLDFAYPSGYELKTAESAGLFELNLILQL